LRREQTDAERFIWNALRAHRLNNASFRRQTPIGPYIADFVGQHFEAEYMKRDAFLASKGFRVLRFNNNDVMMNQEGVLETIAAAIDAAPSPTLPRKRGRESRRAGGESE
jgi:very-short-patch-repair endonuclease